nr:RNA-directed DNA polymerase, eukaryota, reverse transcriptase zinc-binding domain protein [Tanacetum cinerariifolium]
MECLHISFQKVVDAGMFTGINLNQSVNLSHLFYADDEVFVGQWNDRNINTITHVLKCFFHASGLRINTSKSKIMGIHVNRDIVQHVAGKMGCLILNSPFSYLGTKVGGNMSRAEAWKEVVDKVSSRISKWKMNALSIGGRLTLLKSVLGSISIFHMSIFRVPSSVLHKLESIRRNFFNGHDYDSRKASWVKWSYVLADKAKGGLGVSSLFAINPGLMIKWLWKFCDKKHSLWSKIIKAIHGNDGKVDLIRLKLGNGESASFWHDNWSGSGVVKDLFPRLFALENHKEVSVRSKLDDSCLDCTFRRSARGGIEQVQFDALVNLVNLINLAHIVDRWVWTLKGSGEFSVAYIRKVIDANRLKSDHSKTRWVKFVPIKINVLAWKIKMDALPSWFNISRRGIDIPSLSCPICDASIETTDHLFFRYHMAKQITRKIATWWEFDQVENNTYADWSSWLSTLRLPFKNKAMLEEVKHHSAGMIGLKTLI